VMALGSCSRSEELIPSLQQRCLMLQDSSFDAANIEGVHALASRQAHGRQPELAFAFAGIHVHMGRLMTLVRVEVKAPPANTLYGWHDLCAPAGLSRFHRLSVRGGGAKGLWLPETRRAALGASPQPQGGAQLGRARRARRCACR